MTALEGIADAERATMLDAASRLGLDPSGSRLVSASSRLIWHMPVDQVALTITRQNSKSADDIRAEVAAVRAATAAGVRTPPLLAEPAVLPDSRFALPYRWIDGRAFQSTDWLAGVAEAAKLARCEPEGLRRLSWPTDWPDPAWETFLGQQLFLEFGEHIRHTGQTIANLLGTENLVLCHGDLQPANFTVDETSHPWLIDLEYACLGPRSWDAAKIVVLARRFGEPVRIASLLHVWPDLDPHELALCTSAQESQIVAWLACMTRQGAPGARQELQSRASSLVRRDHLRWSHLQRPGKDPRPAHPKQEA